MRYQVMNYNASLQIEQALLIELRIAVTCRQILKASKNNMKQTKTNPPTYGL